ncbi:zinc finger protein 771-like isoform X2 [Phyllopteryx taeniolatus]|uniref:zinc finger protein 771-like isoform X2 n=1 Tax=Phyllopteryx taeniolatus TaxID=161469 RepID=UPI002AD2A4D2|nr:zinc finger protein 771-like isoform X2 [Phyllopteryx taeniolatus]
MCARTTAKYEKELSGTKEEDEPQRQLVDAFSRQPRVVLHRADIGENLCPEWWEPQPPHIKEEVEDEEVPHIKQEEEFEPISIKEEEKPERPHIKLEDEDDVTKFPSTGVPLKSEDEGQSEESRGVEPPSCSSSQDTTREDDGDYCGGSKADGLLVPRLDDISEDLHPARQELVPPHIKEEEKLEPTPIKKEDEEEHTHIKHEVEEDFTKFSSTGVPLKSEDEGQSEENRGAEPPTTSSSQHMTTEGDGDYCGGSEAEGLLAPLSDRDDTSSHPPHTDDDDGQCEGHMMCHTENNRWKCSPCGKIFAFQSNLKQHMKIHTGEKDFACSVCGQRFSVKGNLKTHTRTHTGEKPFACLVCGQRFSVNGNLSKHTRIHTGEKPFACSVCGKRFTKKGDLKIHTRIHTGEKPFACSVCTQRFSKKGNLKIHTRTHTGEKPFACSVCGQRFSKKGDLKIHTRTHTGEKPFSCSVCGQRFSHNYQAKTHKCAGENSSDEEALNEKING